MLYKDLIRGETTLQIQRIYDEKMGDNGRIKSQYVPFYPIISHKMLQIVSLEEALSDPQTFKIWDIFLDGPQF